MFKKIVYILLLTFFVTSCADTLSSVKRGITGEKKNSIDEFLVKKKDPLILPPDFENLPTPDERIAATEEISVFEKNFEIITEDSSSVPTSVEDFILKKIQIK